MTRTPSQEGRVYSGLWATNRAVQRPRLASQGKTRKAPVVYLKYVRLRWLPHDEASYLSIDEDDSTNPRPGNEGS